MEDAGALIDPTTAQVTSLGGACDGTSWLASGSEHPLGFAAALVVVPTGDVCAPPFG